MNIFVLNPSPFGAAVAHCDRHVVKMILETAQLLSTAWHVAAPWRITWEGDTPTLDGHRIYRSTHVKHPCSVWVRQSKKNYEWLSDLGYGLLVEYTHRYGKTHATTPVLDALRYPPPELPDAPMTEFVQAMDDEYKVKGDAVASYRNYYRGAKQHLLQYTNREPPSWLNVGGKK